MFCGCGSSHILARGMCASCYFSHYHDRKHFGGLRERALKRDGRRCTACGSDEQIVVHHRRPGTNQPKLFSTLCRACHARVHQIARLRYGISSHFRSLWEELNPEQPEQLELPLILEGLKPPVSCDQLTLLSELLLDSSVTYADR